jgi:ankyrin repeat protein
LSQWYFPNALIGGNWSGPSGNPAATAVKALLEAGADINKTTRAGSTPLHEACSAEVAKVLLERGVKVNRGDCSGATPLHEARNEETARFLLDNGALLEKEDLLGATPLIKASVARWSGPTPILIVF